MTLEGFVFSNKPKTMKIYTRVLSLVACTAFVCSIGVALAAPVTRVDSGPTSGAVSGRYIEVRSCDIFTGPCFANAEMGLNGQEAILAWGVNKGTWNGTDISGLKVIAVVRAENTLGDLSVRPREGYVALIVDENATEEQAVALESLVRHKTGRLTKEVVAHHRAPVSFSVGDCSKDGCAVVSAGNLVAIETRCLGGDDHVCGNEEVYYPPLTAVEKAHPAFTELAAYSGNDLNTKWALSGQRSAFIAEFSGY